MSRAWSAELAKWFAFALMLGDHANKAWFDGTLPVVTELARVVFPIFALVLGANMARSSMSTRGARERVAGRLGLVGLVASVPYAFAGLGVLPLNVLFTLALGVLSIGCVERRDGWGLIGLAALFMAGAFVDFSVPGVALVVGGYTWATRRWRAWWELAAWCVVPLLGVCAYVAMWYPLAAIPLLALLVRLERTLTIPRLRWAFYAGYPAHLVVLAIPRLLGG